MRRPKRPSGEVSSSCGERSTASDPRRRISSRSSRSACSRDRWSHHEFVAVGAKVRVSSPTESWVKASDRSVARYVADHGGIYDPAAHLRELVIRGDRKASGQASPADRVKANVRRLDRLERYGLVARQPAGQWRVRTDLVSQLEARERTHPRHGFKSTGWVRNARSTEAGPTGGQVAAADRGCPDEPLRRARAARDRGRGVAAGVAGGVGVRRATGERR